MVAMAAAIVGALQPQPAPAQSGSAAAVAINVDAAPSPTGPAAVPPAAAGAPSGQRAVPAPQGGHHRRPRSRGRRADSPPIPPPTAEQQQIDALSRQLAAVQQQLAEAQAEISRLRMLGAGCNGRRAYRPRGRIRSPISRRRGRLRRGVARMEAAAGPPGQITTTRWCTGMCMRAPAPAEGSSPRAPQILTRVAPHGTPACKHAGIRGPWPAPGRWAPTARGGFMAGAATTAPDARPAVRPRRGISRPPRTQRRRGWASRGTSVPRSGQPSALLLGWRRALSAAPLLLLRGTTSRTRPRRAAATKYSRLPSSGHSNGSSAAPAAPRPRPDLLQAPGHV